MKMKGMNVYFQKLIAELCGMVQVPKSSVTIKSIKSANWTLKEYRSCPLC